MVTMMKEKVNTHFSFPLHLDMLPYMEHNLLGPDKLKGKNWENNLLGSDRFNGLEHCLLGPDIFKSKNLENNLLGPDKQW